MRLLEVVGLTKRFGDLVALDAVSFTAEEREIVALVGPAGAGKTTCLDCIAGRARPDSGRLIMDGREVTDLPPRRMARAGIARTDGVPALLRWLTVAQNVLVRVATRPAPFICVRRRATPGRRARTLLDQVGLAADAHRRAGRLPPLVNQRLALARALALEPRLILFDEPLGRLTAPEAAVALHLIADLRARGLTVIFAERRLSGAALAMADRVVVLDKSQVIASGPPGRVRLDPRAAARLETDRLLAEEQR